MALPRLCSSATRCAGLWFLHRSYSGSAAHIGPYALICKSRCYAHRLPILLRPEDEQRFCLCFRDARRVRLNRMQLVPVANCGEPTICSSPPLVNNSAMRRPQPDITNYDFRFPCAHCGYKIPPRELLRVDVENIKCPKCGKLSAYVTKK